MLVVAFGIPGNSNASYHAVPKSVTPYAAGWGHMKASEFVKLSSKDFSRLIGRKMTLKEDISFLIMNKSMKHSIKKNPNLTVNEYMAAHKGISTVGWIFIILGALLLILVIIAIIATGGGSHL